MKVVEVSSDEDTDEFPTRPTEGRGKTEVSSGLPTGNAIQTLDTDQVGQIIPQDVMEDELDVSDNAHQAKLEASPDVERHPAPSTPPRVYKKRNVSGSTKTNDCECSSITFAMLVVVLWPVCWGCPGHVVLHASCVLM